MSGGAIARDGAPAGGPGRGLMAALRDPAVRMRNTDIFAALAAASLPWSTTPPAVFVALWLIALAFTVDWRELLVSLRRPACLLPLAFFALAVVGTLWASSPWPERLHGINPVSKLLLIPLLIYHFERSRRGLWVLAAFLASCALLLAWSYVVLVFPALKLTATDGVPVKNYIDQSQEFALCMFALAFPGLALVRSRRWGLALACAALMLAFFANMMFVVSARTALVYMPVLLALFAALHLRARTTVLLFAGAAVVAVAVWFSSPYLRERVTHIGVEYEGYQNNQITSTAQRLGYWTRSLKFIAKAPLVGNGTGSTKMLFEQDAAGKSGLAADVIGNPHNQTLNVAVQWGLLGCLVLYAMWIAHLLLFRGPSLAAYVGLLVVVQNMVSSLLNSHLFDFHEGWMYVIGVGVAGGMALKARRDDAAAPPRGAAASGGARP
ncbi:O-antigen ligase family protein [Bradyrhizobium sp. 2TAF24]|uniref:O-antigen ligase family protein n=1 Tax=Bradyrhizobium sp. 2TAF24 TaxID=3233011 RepID=UPI003F8FA742